MHLLAMSIAFVALSGVLTSQVAAPSAATWVAGYRQLGGDCSLIAGRVDAIGIRKLMNRQPWVKVGALPSPSGVKRIVLQGNGVDDNDLVALATWPGLQEIEILDGWSVTGKGLTNIAGIGTLRRLVLVDTRVTDKVIDELAGHPMLAELEISNPLIFTALQAVRLRDLPQMRKLSISAEGVERLALLRLPKLCAIDSLSASLKTVEIVDTPELTELDFARSDLVELTVRNVSKLKVIDLRNTKLSDEVISKIRAAAPHTVVKR